jgi:hypothetical protein
MSAENRKYFQTLEAAQEYADQVGGKVETFKHLYPKPYVEYFVIVPGGTDETC